ncbi:hypothetical protein GC098_14770 [Paenibacillus sp. LMG 31458]|uniref:HTH araC/xylS-type domain-containing protein n=1 Tax=Paenibacillus phytorum TaxID=2654977 RepID=A0ABX1XVZ0_9BACL|nr:helix-turn-helix transcriptional regulator [Paenibacillus phytorum]NOU72671.1 hypothetical protein [Paenibacillus phytorum]
MYILQESLFSFDELQKLGIALQVERSAYRIDMGSDPLDHQNETSSAVTREVVAYIKDNYNKDLSLQSVADFVAISPAHLCRLIKKENL